MNQKRYADAVRSVGAMGPITTQVTPGDKAFLQFTKDFLATIDKPSTTKHIQLFFARLWDRLAAPYRKHQALKFQREHQRRIAAINAQLAAEELQRAQKKASITQSEIETVVTRFNSPELAPENIPQPPTHIPDEQLIQMAVNKLGR